MNVVQKTIVAIDMANYGFVLDTLAESVGSVADAQIRNQIRNIVTESLVAAGLSKTAIFDEAGDSVLLAFSTPDEAHQFAMSLRRTTSTFNSSKRHKTSLREFRIGIATGEICVEPDNRISGKTLTDATRLEQACDTLGIVVDRETLDGFSANVQSLYSNTKSIVSKHGFEYKCHALEN